MLVNSTVINKLLLSEWLLRISKVSHGWIHNLLNPKDAQNVPRAIDLMKTVEELKDVPSRNPSEDSTSVALRLFGEVLDSSIQPFINPDLSLTKQVTNLLTTSLLLFVIFDDHSTAFMSNQLYGDLQAMIKNAMFLVARTQVLDPSQEVFFTLLGDDVLETLFGLVHMLGGHSPNCDGKELAERLSRAMNLRDIYERNPELEKKAPRLSMTRSRDADHLRPRNWKGNVTASSCDLKKCYKYAVSHATGILGKYGITKEFEKLFSMQGVDLMRPPCSKGSYPGLSKDHDRSMDATSEEEVHTSSAGAGRSTQAHKGDDPSPGSAPDPEGCDLVDGTKADADTADQVPDISTRDAGSQPQDPPETLSQSPPSNDHQQLESARIVYELIQQEEAFEKDGYDRRKSTDRILRVRCYSIGGEKWEVHVEGSQLPEDDKFTFGNLFVTLLHIPEGGVALAVLQTTAMRSHDVSVPAVSRKEMVLPVSNCTLSGQVLSLIPLADINPETEYDTPLTHWAWDGEYIAFNPSTKPSADTPETLSQKALVISVPGFLAIPLVEEAAHTLASHLPSSSLRRKQGLETTWEIPHEFLRSSAVTLWESARRSKALSKIPTVGRVIRGNFPYRENGKLVL
ncbi:hypothetical protein AAF712_012815 [Marasmius tenuissimus]|uniref:Uncharacterized protein n=1 Tax=Marasmius tenuissimus TaxID=585030 RepID=A0ABR2ZGD3_9AGAR